VDGRIEAGFRYRFRTLLALVSAEGLDVAVETLLRQGRERVEDAGISVGRAWAELYEETRKEVEQRLEAEESTEVEAPWQRFSGREPPRFLCDPSLGGLARWLRAAGYEAFVDTTIPGHRLPDEALRRGHVLLTTESEVLLRRVVVDGSLVVVWVPSALTMKEQLPMVMRDLALDVREARCMACGGELVPTAKDAIFDRIPPRTAKWLDEYFVCAGCDGLFWRGTHWERIARTLEEAAAS
jgi:uncharacterized protein with PIN domain